MGELYKKRPKEYAGIFDNDTSISSISLKIRMAVSTHGQGKTILMTKGKLLRFQTYL